MPNGFLRHFDACNRHDLSKFVPFYIGNQQYGWVAKDLLPVLREIKEFSVSADKVTLPPHDFSTASEILAAAAKRTSTHRGTKLRNEMYPVIREWGDEPRAQIDRAAVPWFGVRGFGVHVNGFTRKNGEIHLWIGERAADRQVDPGKLDNMIGGGQPIGLTPEQNVAKEAKEEAGLDAAIASKAKHVSTLRYMLEKQGGLRNDVLFVYDLELPHDMQPRNTDGEVAAFHLMSLPEAAGIIRTTDRFKFNCNLVIIDFLVRWGCLDSNHMEFNKIKDLLAA